MKIGIDARFLTHPQKGGFKTYTENLVRALSNVDYENEYVLYVDRQPQNSDRIPNQANFHCRVASGGSRFFEMPLREQYYLPKLLNGDKIDIFHAPCLTAPVFLEIPAVVTIHDMIWYYPTRYSRPKTLFHKRKFLEWYYQFVPFIAARRASAVITVSNASKQRIIEHMKLANNKIFVTYEAVSSLFRPIMESGSTNNKIQENNLKSNYILGIGSADPRKNIKTLIKAYALLPDQLKKVHNLAIVWNHKLLASESVVEAQNLDVSKYIHFLDDVSDEQLVALYNQASLFVFPSLEEGFGLPPLEAMTCGTPVLAANNSSIPEIVGDAAMLFHAESIDGLADLMKHVLSNLDLQRRMKIRGIERAAKFSWINCALETLDVYKRVSDSKRER